MLALPPVEIAIETKGVTKVFKRGKIRALDGVDLKVGEGEIFALLGPNGAGKTTLIKILATLLLPTSGEARICGWDAAKKPRQVKKLISLMAGDERSFYWRLTGRQNLNFFAALYNLFGKEARQKIEEAAALFGLEALDRRYQEYSTGTKHRLALARSFLNGAKIIFMDEPTRSLDPNAAFQLRELVKKKVRDGVLKTVFFTTHQTEEAQGLADRMAILEKGKIKACGSLGELRSQAGLPSASLAEIFRSQTLERATQ